MCDSSRHKKKDHSYPTKKMRFIHGSKWEYPVPNSKEYWRNLCDDLERKSIKVRDPSLKLSYHSPSILSPCDLPISGTNNSEESFNRDCPTKVKNNAKKTFTDSLHKVLPYKSANEKQLLEAPQNLRVISATSSSSTEPLIKNPKRTPNLRTASLQPSFGKIMSCSANRIQECADIQNALSAAEENLNINSSFLPTLGKSPTVPETESTTKKSTKKILPSSDSLKIPEVNGPDKPTVINNAGNKDAIKEVLSTVKAPAASNGDLKGRGERLYFGNSAFVSNKIETNGEPMKTQTAPRYSTRCAYRALKFLTANKKLDFEPKANQGSFQRSESKSSRGTSIDTHENFEPPGIEDIEKLERDDEEPASFHEVQKKLKRMRLRYVQSASTETADASFKSETSVSKTIPSVSRSTSGPSLEFARPETVERPSTRTLAFIPKFGGFPRKTHDRCLPCMYKSFQAPGKLKISLPRTILQRSISQKQRVKITQDTSLESNVSSLNLLNLEKEIGEILGCEHGVKNILLNKEFKTVEPATSGTTQFAPETDPDNATRQKSTVGLEVAGKLDRTKNILEQRVDGEHVLLKRATKVKLKPAITSTSLSATKMSSSSEGPSSDEDDSLSITIGDDPSKSKYFAPCHAPTILCPSLEALRALRNRKPTTLQSRIALNESASAKKDMSVEDVADKAKLKSGDIQQTQKADKLTSSKIALGDCADKGRKGTDDEDKDIPSARRALTKVKSVSEKLTLEAVDSVIKKGRHILKRGSSSPSLMPTPEKRVVGTSEISETKSQDAMASLHSIHKSAYFKTFPTAHPSKFAESLPLRTIEEIMDVLEELTISEENVSQTEMLDTLCKEFLARVSKELRTTDINAKRCNKTATRLTKLLADSKRYLYPDKFPSDLVFSANQPPLCNPRQLRRILPLDSYNLVAPLLGMPKWYPKKEIVAKGIDMKHHRISTRRSSDESTFDLLVHPPTLKDITSDGDVGDVNRRKPNPYALFLKKPRRKAVTWRPLTEHDLRGYDPDATLSMRAKNIMNKICYDFCEWLNGLGGSENVVDEEVLRDMFEIDFDAEACRAMQVSIQEMSMVPTEVAWTRNSPGASKLAMTQKHILRDTRAERRPEKTRAFGSSIPWEHRFVPPNNQVEKRWLQCEYVPQDLETMEAVWKDITHLRSVRGFVKWLREHPEVSPPDALRTIASVDINALRQTEDDELFAHLELDLDQIGSLKVADNNPALIA